MSRYAESSAHRQINAEGPDEREQQHHDVEPHRGLLHVEQKDSAQYDDTQVELDVHLE